MDSLYSSTSVFKAICGLLAFWKEGGVSIKGFFVVVWRACLKDGGDGNFFLDILTDLQSSVGLYAGAFFLDF